MDDSRLANALLRRIAIREKSRAQVNFLRLLASHTLGDSLILYGSAALHGVHLQERFPEDLDFLAPEEIAATFGTDFARYGLPIKLAATPSGERVPAYFERGTVFERVVVSIDVTSRDSLPAGEERTFHGLSGTVLVHAVPFLQMVAEKVNCVSERGEPTDYTDLFLALRKSPAIASVVAEVLREAAETHSRPRWVSEAARKGLETVAQHWTESIGHTMLVIPAFTDVSDTLLRFFDFLDTCLPPTK
ncbi:MAG: nucleotidyl transferase AbiEii/AbiGii toxin family protein [Capsulimonadales bacterium]|nr:nucleotidyl transferase AbiEii/AbiGii toxin family protein [Capsulimonadales bacterium]